MSGRSTNGCWTCRLRKKKCDESRPTCKRCSELGVSCHGYGPRPHWMDRGPLQREAAHRMKSIVSRRRTSPQDPEQFTQEPSRLSSDSGYGTSPSLAGRSALNNSNLEQEFMLDNLDLDLGLDAFTGKDTHGNDPYHNIGGGIANMNLLSDSMFFSHPSPIPLVQAQLDAIGVDTSMQDAAPDMGSAMAGFHQMDVSQLWSDLTSPIQQNNLNLAARQSIAISQRQLHEQRCSSAGLVSPVNEQTLAVIDEDLLMDYFDRVFYTYCPFYTSKQQQSRGWLLSALQRDSASYHAALALTELHRPSQLLPHDQGSHHHLALREIQARLAHIGPNVAVTSSSDRIGLLTALLHLLFYELSLGGKHNWQMQLNDSANLLRPAVQQLSASTIRRSNMLAQNNFDAHSSTDIAIGFLLSFFVCIDIIGSASTRSSPVLTLNHKLVLETCDANPVNLIGCDGMVMICILDITSLDNWKREMSKAHELSLIELAERGRSIEKRLRGILANVEAELSRDYTDLTGITRIYALAAIIYLHVIISGAHPKIPEIAESVSKTIDALQSLSDAKLLGSVVWPFCVSGCLATSSQEHHYRKLVSPSYMTEPRFATCLESFEIMKECWQSRKTTQGTYDWASIMQKRQEFILLA